MRTMRAEASANAHFDIQEMQTLVVVQLGLDQATGCLGQILKPLLGPLAKLMTTALVVEAAERVEHLC